MIEPREETAIKKLWSYCFEPEGHPFFEWYFGKYYKPENVLAGVKDGHLLCCLHLNPYKIFLRGQVFATSYIVGVATAPEARSQKSIGGLLAESLVEMRRRGQWVVLLMPFKGIFYYPYDFEFCYHSLLYDVDLADLRFAASGDGVFKAVTEENICFLQPVYEAYTKDLHGYPVRQAASWRQLYEEHQTDQGHAYLLFEADEAAGYIFYMLKEDKVVVKEMAYRSETAKQALLRFCYNHRSQVSRLYWLAPIDDGTLFSLPDPKVGVSIYPFMTARIVDVVKALSEVSYPSVATGRIVFAVNDPLSTWNHGTFALTVQEGRGQVVKLTDEMIGEAECRFTSGTLAQLLFGRVSASQLYKMGKITAPLAALALLDQFFPACTNYINEYY
ncbi:MAG: GNAT family N-acetyltransferase [Sporomusaceae bacterium]|nr:GNAT family N-acetyltransferase [Sporomusaceae bacterium]